MNIHCSVSLFLFRNQQQKWNETISFDLNCVPFLTLVSSLRQRTLFFFVLVKGNSGTASCKSGFIVYKLFLNRFPCNGVESGVFINNSLSLEFVLWCDDVSVVRSITEAFDGLGSKTSINNHRNLENNTNMCIIINIIEAKSSWHPFELYNLRAKLLGRLSIDMHKIAN